MPRTLQKDLTLGFDDPQSVGRREKLRTALHFGASSNPTLSRPPSDDDLKLARLYRAATHAGETGEERLS